MLSRSADSSLPTWPEHALQDFLMHTEDKQFLRRETRLPADTYMADTTPYAVDTVTVYVAFYEAHKPYC